MVIDTSVIAAILFGKDDAELFAQAIEDDSTRLMSAAKLNYGDCFIHALSKTSGAVWNAKKIGTT